MTPVTEAGKRLLTRSAPEMTEMEDCLRAADEAWDSFFRDVRFAARRGLPTDLVMERHRPLIEAAVLGEPDPREFAELTFDEQRQAFARLQRQWARERDAGFR